MEQLQTEILVDEAAFRHLRENWKILLENSSNNNPFRSWEWLHEWHKNMGAGVEKLFIIIVRKGRRRLVGIAPFSLNSYKILNRERVALQLVGQNYSFDLGIIARRGYEIDVSEHISSCVFQNSDKWDILNLIHLEKDESLFNKIKSLGKENNSVFLQQMNDSCKVIELPEKFEKYLSNLSENARGNIRRNINKLQNNFEVQFETIMDLASFRSYWPLFLNLHRENVHAKGRRTILDNDNFALFYYNVGVKFAESGRLRLNLLRLDGAIMAIQMCAVSNETLYFLNMGQSTILPKRYGLGTVILSLSIKDSIDKGLKYYNLLGGGGGYKERFGGKDYGGNSLKIFRFKRDYWLEKIEDQVRAKLKKYNITQFLKRKL